MKKLFTTIGLVIMAAVSLILIPNKPKDEPIGANPPLTFFAEIDADGTVLRVIVADQAFIDSGVVGNPANWIQTYRDDSQRRIYAGKDYTYDRDKDVFIRKKTFDSWVLDDQTLEWKPSEKPNDGKEYEVDEDTGEWKVQ